MAFNIKCLFGKHVPEIYYEKGKIFVGDWDYKIISTSMQRCKCKICGKSLPVEYREK